jgi:hypothetical protein
MSTELSEQPRVERQSREDEDDSPQPASRDLKAARALSAILAILLATSSAVGLFVSDLYRDPASVAAMLRGYDLTALVIIAPLLALTLLPALRRSARARLLWAGALAYSVYHSAIYVFGTEFNDIFLIHVAVFSLSVFALGLALANMEVAAIARRFADRTPARFVGGILLFLAVILAVFWALPSIRFAFTGELPQEGSKLIVPIAITHLGWVLDLSLLVPAYVLAGVLLWRRAAWGYALGTIVLVGGLVQQVEYMTALVFQANADIPGASAFDPVEPVIATLYLIGSIALLARISRDRGTIDGAQGSVANESGR